MNTDRKRQIRLPRQGGFTILEAAFAIMIIGFGVVALMRVFVSGNEVNSYGDKLSKAVFLSEEIRAMTDNEPFDNLPAYDGLSFNGVDANGNGVAGLEGFRQSITVEGIDPADMTVYIGADPPAYHLTATVTRDGQELTHLSWLRSP